jgi:CubicO group peptidase (beta-lactamase class C family)
MIRYDVPFSPEEVSYYPERLDTLHGHLEKLVKNKDIYGANYCLSRDGKVFAYNAVGKLSYREDDDRPLKPDTMVEIASVTKLFCATAIFKLVEDGQIRLDQKVSEFIDEFKEPLFNNINIAHLLSHTSGMAPDPGCFENKFEIPLWHCLDHAKDDNWIAIGLEAGMRNDPGKEWAYCTFGYMVLGEIISRVTGVFANDYIIENLVKPCEMADTTYNPTPTQAQNFIIASERVEKEINACLAGERVDDSIWSKIPLTGFGLFSTPLDLCKFGTMLLHNGIYNGKRVLGRKAIEKMTALYTTPDIKDYCWGAGGVSRAYGLGPDLRCNLTSLYTKGTFFHEGAGGCCLIVDPIEKLVAAWFVPYVNDIWCASSLYNTAAIMWSGLK